MRTRKIRKRSCTAFRKLMCVRSRHSLEEAFHFFGKTFRFSEEAFRFAAETYHKCISERRSNRGINFKDAYCMALFAIQFFCLYMYTCTNHLTTKRIHTQDHSVRNAVSVHEDRLSIHAIVNLLLERMPGSMILQPILHSYTE